MFGSPGKPKGKSWASLFTSGTLTSMLSIPTGSTFKLGNSATNGLDSLL